MYRVLLESFMKALCLLSQGALMQSKCVQAAEVLCDPYKRRQYDAEQAAAAYAPQASSSQRNKPEE